MHPDPDLDVQARGLPEAREFLDHREAHVGHLGRAGGQRHDALGPGLPREAADDHVGVADGLDLLEAVAFGELVAHREDAVQQIDDLGRREARRERGESHDVGEQDGHVVEPVRDDGLAAAEPLGDGPRQDVEQEALVGGAEGLDLAGGRDVRAVHVDRVVLVHRDHAEAEDPAFGLDLEGRVRGVVPGGEDPGEHRRVELGPNRRAERLLDERAGRVRERDLPGAAQADHRVRVLGGDAVDRLLGRELRPVEVHEVELRDEHGREPEGPAALGGNLRRRRGRIGQRRLQVPEQPVRDGGADLEAERPRDRLAGRVGVREPAGRAHPEHRVRVAVREPGHDLGRGDVRAVDVIGAELGDVDREDLERSAPVGHLEGLGRRRRGRRPDPRQGGLVEGPPDVDAEPDPDGCARVVRVRHPAVLGDPHDRVRVLAREPVDRRDLALEEGRRHRARPALQSQGDDARQERHEERHDIRDRDRQRRLGSHRPGLDLGAVVDERQQGPDAEARECSAHEHAAIGGDAIPRRGRGHEMPPRLRRANSPARSEPAYAMAASFERSSRRRLRSSG